MRTMILELDDDDFNAIQAEITLRQLRGPLIGDKGSLPEGDSNLAGAVLAECVRDLAEYRDLFNSQRPP